VLFRSTGAHITTSCILCHVNGQYQGGIPTDCWSCHQADYNGTQDPNHVAGGFPHDCSLCHTTDNWNGGGFNHSGTNFPLTGAHIGLACALCHASGQYNGLPSDCWSCHQANYEGATSPNHISNQFPHDCTPCHSTSAWQPSTFDHSQSPFPLTGAHVSVSCILCRVNGQYQGTPTDCWSCHQANYNGVTDPNHVSGNYDHNCTICHTTSGWSPATFDHSGTNFPLTGAHVNAACALCHVNGQFQGTPTDCIYCHQNDYNNAKSPVPHTGFGLLQSKVVVHWTHVSVDGLHVVRLVVHVLSSPLALGSACHCVWLNALIMSARNWRRCVPLNVQFFDSDRSV
jgi:hypothetical protein